MNLLFNINVCRVCMQSNQSCNLWSDKDLLQKFEYTTRLAITEEDNLPKSICSRCTIRLKVAFNFIKKAHESENNLKSFLAKIHTEFKEVTQGNNSVNRSPNEQNFSDDDLISLIGEENHEHFFANADLNEKQKKSRTLVINTKKNRTDLEECHLKFAKEKLKSKKEVHDNWKNDKIVYRLSQEILLIDDSNKEIDNEYESNSHFMEIPTQVEEEDDIKKANYNEEVEKNDILEKNQTYTGVNILAMNEEFEIRSQSTELTVQESEENHEYGVVANSHDKTIQYQSIFVDENSIDQNEKPEIDKFYLNNLSEDDIETCLNSPRNDNIIESATKLFHKVDNAVYRFYCDKCNRDFSTKTNLNRHMQSHEGNKPFSCAECRKSFTQKSTLKQHMYTHTGERPYVCEVCNRGFTQCKSLIFHMRRHTGEKPFLCEYCLITFRQKDALRIHILKHHVIIEQTSNGNEIFTCIICQTKFGAKAEFKTHMKVHTSTAEFDNVADLVKDEKEWSAMKIINNPSDNGSDLLTPLQSEYFNAAVINVSASSAAEPNRAKKFQCRKCFKCFALKKSLLRHMRIHYANNDEESKECLDCELQFSSVELYQQHLSDCHQYACSVCPELVFKTAQDLKIHLFEHELDQEEHTQ